MKLSYKTSSQDQTITLGKVFGSLLRPGDTVLLSGDLGAGKTQFVKGIAAAWNIEEPITSPTFNIMFEHYMPKKYYPELGFDEQERVLLRHFDLYRLNSVIELEDIDYFGLLEDGALNIVEWGDKFPGAMPQSYWLVTISCIDESTRKVDFETHGRHVAGVVGCDEDVLDVLQGLMQESDGARPWQES